MSRKKMSSRVGAVAAAVAIAVGLMIVGGCGDDNDGGGGGDGVTFTDSRDGQSYRIVKIGKQTWMAENLNYTTAKDSWCYRNSTSNCATYGRLYAWDVAMSACPAGWHLPSSKEWNDLVTFAGGAGVAGGKLKSITGWNNYNGASGNGTNTFGFSAMPGGRRYGGGTFDEAGEYGSWWSATESGSIADYLGMDYSTTGAYEYDGDKGNGYSVRCIKN